MICFLDHLRGAWRIRCGDCHLAVCIYAVPSCYDCTECAGSARIADCIWHFHTYSTAGSAEYCGCHEFDSDDRHHPPVCQLWRYLHRIFDGRDGAGAERVETDTLPIMQEEGEQR